LNYLAKARQSELTKGEGIHGPVLIDATAKIGKGVSIGPNVTIGPNCVIEDGVRLKNTVILEGVLVGAHSWINQSIIGWRSRIGKWVRIQNVSVLGEDVGVKDELFLNGARILHHKDISESIPDEKIVM